MINDYYTVISRWLMQYFGVAANEFDRGFCTALALVITALLLLIVLGLIIKLIFRKPAVEGVSISGDNGDIFISRNAITGAIRQLQSSFPEFEVLKTALRMEKRQLVITLTVNFNPTAGTLIERVELLKRRIFSDLTTTFGIGTLERIDVRLHKTIDSSTSAPGDNDPGQNIDGGYVAGF